MTESPIKAVDSRASKKLRGASKRLAVADMSRSKRFEVAVFPLTNEVLFPGVTLPLHIFEHHYGQMLRDIQAKGWPLAVSLLTPKENSELGLNLICGAGQVQVSKTYEDGRSDILVHGQQRVGLCKVIQQEPYVIMKAETVESEYSNARVQGRTFEEFRNLLRTWAFIHPKLPEYLSLVFDDFNSFGELSDFFVFHFVKDVHEKQTYLNCVDPVERAEMLVNHIEDDLVRFSRRLIKDKKLLPAH